MSDVWDVNGSFRQFFRCFVGSVGASGCPDDQDLFILKVNRLNERCVIRSQFVAYFKQFLLDSVDFRERDSNRWQNRASTVIFDSDYDITTAPIVKIVGECSDAMHCRDRVPAPFKLDPLPLHSSAVYQITDIHRKSHQSGVSPGDPTVSHSDRGSFMRGPSVVYLP